MEAGDWLNAFIYIGIGLFLGIAADGIVQLATTAFWPIAVILVLLFTGIFIFELILDKLFDFILPIGIRPPRERKEKGRTPLPLLLSFPVGMAIGIVLARFGLGKTILDMFP